MKETWRKLVPKLKRPTGWLLASTYILTVVFCVGAIVLAVLAAENMILQIFSYVSYALAAVTLGYSVYSIVLYAPTMKASITAWIKRSATGKRMLEHYGFRTIIFATCSLIVNVAYVAFNVLLAIAFRSVWYGALAGYYGLLTALRSGIVLYHRNKSKTGFSDEYLQKRTEIRKYRTCGIMLTVIPVCLSFAILQMVTEGRAFVHWSWTAIAFAAYAFYKITMAIYNAVKAKKQDDITVRALRNVGLADALVSILALQTTLLYAYSSGANSGVANALTGGVVCALTLVIGGMMIMQASKKNKELNKEENNGRKSE